MAKIEIKNVSKDYENNDGTILHASMPTRLPTSPSLVKVPSMEVVTTIHGGQ